MDGNPVRPNPAQGWMDGRNEKEREGPAAVVGPCVLRRRKCGGAVRVVWPVSGEGSWLAGFEREPAPSEIEPKCEPIARLGNKVGTVHQHPLSFTVELPLKLSFLPITAVQSPNRAERERDRERDRERERERENHICVEIGRAPHNHASFWVVHNSVSSAVGQFLRHVHLCVVQSVVDRRSSGHPSQKSLLLFFLPNAGSLDSW